MSILTLIDQLAPMVLAGHDEQAWEILRASTKPSAGEWPSVRHQFDRWADRLYWHHQEPWPRTQASLDRTRMALANSLTPIND